MRSKTVPADDAELLQDLLRRRRSCRAYLPEPVPRPVIVQALEMAQRTASWCNVQPWSIHITSGEATQRFRAALTNHVASAGWPQYSAQGDFDFPSKSDGVYRARQREAAWAYYASVGIAHGDRAASAKQSFENFRLFGAPHFMLVTSPRSLGVYGAIDCGGYVANFLLAAESLGLGAVAQGAIAMCSPFIHSYFGIGDEQVVVCGISFGFADRDHPANGFATTRVDMMDSVVFLDE